jgi:hypothetical protein
MMVRESAGLHSLAELIVISYVTYFRIGDLDRGYLLPV